MDADQPASPEPEGTTQMSFADRLFQASQDVYDRIEQGQVTDVEAELMDAHLNASADEED